MISFVYDVCDFNFVDTCNIWRYVIFFFFFFQAEDGIRDLVRSRGLGDVYKRQIKPGVGQNNHFYIIAPENFNGSILKMDIYDRWGNKVFEQKNLPFNDPSSGWDGNFKGTEVEQGVYVFVIEILDFSDNQTKKYYGDPVSYTHLTLPTSDPV